MRILAGDIGGTNTRFILFDRAEDGVLRPVGRPTKFKNAEFESFDAILQRFAEQCDGVTDACLGIAGPVAGRRVRLTNIEAWPEIDADAVATRLEIAEPHHVNLINDMPAHAASLSSIERLHADHVVEVRSGAVHANGARAIVMPGTGLGIGALVWDEHGQLHRPIPTEAGHTDMAARDRATTDLLASMRKVVGPRETISREHFLSGPGLRAIYACLANPSNPDPDAAPKGETFGSIEGRDPIAKRTLDLFTQLLGELCANVAFTYLTTGGLYLAGSIATSLRGRIASPLFREPFERSGPPGLRGLITSVPVNLVTYEETGLLGAATYATWAAERRV